MSYFLKKAEENCSDFCYLPLTPLLVFLMPCLNPSTGKNEKNYGWASGGSSILSEFGTLHLEFATLTHLTGNEEYLQKVLKIRDVLINTEKTKWLCIRIT